MSHRPIPYLLLRAPLLPVSALGEAAAAIEAHPLGRAALALASPDLDRARAGESERGAEVTAAIARYARRAAFRPTPAGLLAGVAGAVLGQGTRIHVAGGSASGAGAAVLAPAVDVSWGRLGALGRALLEDSRVRLTVKLRQAPSLLVSGDSLVWLALEREGCSERTASLDPTLAAVLAATRRWTGWGAVRRRLGRALGGDRTGGGLDPGDLDLFLLDLVDQGLLLHDLTPPLVGDPPAAWMVARLARSRAAPARAAAVDLQAARELAGRLEIGSARQRLASLPGADLAPRPDLTATLGFGQGGNEGGGNGGEDDAGGDDEDDRSVPASVLDAAVVARAAELAPLLFRLQEALAAPVAERALDPEGLARLRGIAELFGAGAYDLPALGNGAYGVLPSDGEEPRREPGSPPPALQSHLCQLLLAAAQQGRDEIHLSRALLEEILPAVEPPPSFELILTPAAAGPDQPEGSGWMIALHGPAGASLGRFAGDPRSPAARALRALAAGEQGPGEQVLDVVAAASVALADLGVHPPMRRSALALTGWPAGHAVTPAELQLVIDEAALDPLALRRGGAGSAPAAVAPAPLSRVRSTTMPPGIFRLLAGWSLLRQHAPWALTFGPLAELPFLPRVVLEGFVVAPASWRLPALEQLARPEGVAAWRRQARVPGLVQVGEGDELLPVDLSGAAAAEELRRAGGQRAFEIWPPLDRLPDSGGRRVEAVVAMVAPPDARRLASVAATRRAGRVPPPREVGPAPGWRTFRIYGPEEAQDAVLHEAVAPLVARARQGARGGALRRWYFLRYRDPESGRPHLRVRLCAATDVMLDGLGRQLGRALRPLRGAGLVVTVEAAEYFPETARYGGEKSMAAVETIFQAGSELLLATLALSDQGGGPLPDDPRGLFVRAADALGRALGLDLAARRQLAERRRLALATAAGGEDPDWKLQFRGLGRQLADRLSGGDRGEGDRPDPAEAPLRAFEAAVRTTASRAARPVRLALREVLPALLHTQAVRMLGTRVEDEQASYVFWSRALESSAARTRSRGGG